MISRDGTVQLVDFGLAKARSQLLKTKPGFVKGKFGYLAPEQLGGEVDGRTDVFALGLCLFEALTGRQLFNQASAAETVRAIASYTAPPQVSSLVHGSPPALDSLVARALARGPSERFQRAAEMRDAIGALLGPHRPSAAVLAALVREAKPNPLPSSTAISGTLPATTNASDGVTSNDLAEVDAMTGRYRAAQQRRLFVSAVLIGVAIIALLALLLTAAL
jgi:serine/threonine protein kinase